MIPQNTPKLNHYLYETNSNINELKGLTALAIIWCCVVQKQTWGRDSHVLGGVMKKADVRKKRRWRPSVALLCV